MFIGQIKADQCVASPSQGTVRLEPVKSVMLKEASRHQVTTQRHSERSEESRPSTAETLRYPSLHSGLAAQSDASLPDTFLETRLMV